MNSPIFKQIGLVRVATIVDVYPNTMTVDIAFNNNIGDIGPINGTRRLYKAQLPISYLSKSGGFIGGLVSRGTTVAVVQSEGGNHYFIVAFLATDPSSNNRVTTANIKNLKDGNITIQAHENISISLDKQSIAIGDPSGSMIFNNSMVFDISKKLAINSFSNSYTMTEASREITGIILRDKTPQENFSHSLKTTDGSFNSILKEIGMDPIAETTTLTYGSSFRNPARIEKRELVFEYTDIAKIKSNDEELKKYRGEPIGQATVKGTTIINRRDSRADTLSLSLVSPNHLMETIKGTVVDIYGNILDINRDIIPIGKKDFSISEIKSTINNQSKNVYEEIKRLERKSLAYHFEINARKELNKLSQPDVTVPAVDENGKKTFARDRSRFFLDIDKEGLFKLNVPASSNTGNIPLHTRYENYSTVKSVSSSGSNDPNDVFFNKEYKDILIEKYLGTGPIKIVDKDGNNASPIDRFSKDGSPIHIGHGTVYHDISRVARGSTAVQFYNPQEYEPTTLFDPNSSGHITNIKSIVSDKIIISGDKANAGGRSASINMDGSLELNVGANQVDKQSLWLDTEGGIVASIGQDKQNEISIAASLDGSVFLEVGNNDEADKNDDTKRKARIFDLRVADGVGNMTCFRIDKYGLSVTTHGRYTVYSSGDMMFRSAARITMDAENIILNGRSVYKDPTKGPIR